jgi:glutathione S-transferase
MKVGGSRKKFMEKATKDGEKDAEIRYALPNMYVDGHTENARLFNCVQRGHHQALETYPQFLLFSVLGGIRFPVFTALSGMMWVYARQKWAEGYATGKPENRYSHWAGHGVWYGLLGCLLATVGTTLGVFGVA